MKLCLALLPALFCVSLSAFADDDKPTINVDLQTRVSYLNDRVDNEIRHDASGFKGEYLLLMVSGQINDRISYLWRQRLNKKIDKDDKFDATDWVYVNYKADAN